MCGQHNELRHSQCSFDPSEQIGCSTAAGHADGHPTGKASFLIPSSIHLSLVCRCMHTRINLLNVFRRPFLGIGNRVSSMTFKCGPWPPLTRNQGIPAGLELSTQYHNSISRPEELQSFGHCRLFRQWEHQLAIGQMSNPSGLELQH